MSTANNFIAFQAVILFQMMYIILQYVFVQKREYLYYFGYMACMSLYLVLKYEPLLGIRFFTAIDLQAEHHFDRALPLFSYFLYYRFARYFADIATVSPSINQKIIKVEWIILAYVVFELIWAFLGISREVGEYIFWLFSLFLFITAIYFGVQLFVIQHKQIWFLITGAVAVNVGALITLILLYYSSLWAIDPFIPLMVGIFIELLAFTTGLALKVQLSESVNSLREQEISQQQNRNIALQNKFNQIRVSIATDFHNDLTDSLSSINIYAEMLKKSSEKYSDHTVQLVRNIYQTTNQLLKRVDDMVWALNPATKGIEDVVKKLKLFEREEIEQLGIKIEFATSEADSGLLINISSIKNIYFCSRETLLQLATQLSPSLLLCKFDFRGDKLVVVITAKHPLVKEIEEQKKMEEWLSSLAHNSQMSIDCLVAEPDGFEVSMSLWITNISD